MRQSARFPSDESQALPRRHSGHRAPAPWLGDRRPAALRMGAGALLLGLAMTALAQGASAPAAMTPSPVPAAPASATTDTGSMPPAPAPAPTASVVSPAPTIPGAGLVIRTMGPISYVCGGIGADEQRQLTERERDFNMSVLFTQGPRGEYLSDVDVKLTREGYEVAQFRTNGPRCLIRAPEGSYNLLANYNGQARSLTLRTGTRNAQLRW